MANADDADATFGQVQAEPSLGPRGLPPEPRDDTAALPSGLPDPWFTQQGADPWARNVPSTRLGQVIRDAAMTQNATTTTTTAPVAAQPLPPATPMQPVHPSPETAPDWGLTGYAYGVPWDGSYQTGGSWYPQFQPPPMPMRNTGPIPPMSPGYGSLGAAAQQSAPPRAAPVPPAGRGESNTETLLREVIRRLGPEMMAPVGRSEPNFSDRQSPPPGSDPFKGPGANDARKTITGELAQKWLVRIDAEVSDRIRMLNAPSAAAAAMMNQRYQDRRPCPTFNGSDPVRTLREWIQSQIHWIMLTNSPYSTWGILLYEALPRGTTPRSLADAISEEVRTSPEGYAAIARKLLEHYQPYLETELEVCWHEVRQYPKRQHKELFTSYTNGLRLKFEELAKQLSPAKFDDRLEAMELHRLDELCPEQRTQLALKRAGYG